MAKKLIYIISDIDKALAFEWVALRLKEKFNLKFILIGKKDSKLALWLQTNEIAYFEISDSEFSGRLKKWLHLIRILKFEKPHIIHTHLWTANVLGLTAAWLLRIKQRVFTRHHGMIHYDEIPAGRKWDRLCNFLATDIVAISKNIEHILIDRDKANRKKIRLIHHGFDFDYFQTVSTERGELLRKRYGITNNTFPVVGVIARYMRWKGVEYIIQAYQQVLLKFPEAKLILANAKGDHIQAIKHSLQALPPTSFVEIIFEDDLAALYHLFDIYVHAPHDAHSEAFGQTYVEALINEVPAVFTLSGVAKEFIVHDSNAWVVDFKNSEQIATGILALASDAELRNRLTESGKKSVERFTIDNHMNALEKLYRL